MESRVIANNEEMDYLLAGEVLELSGDNIGVVHGCLTRTGRSPVVEGRVDELPLWQSVGGFSRTRHCEGELRRV